MENDSLLRASLKTTLYLSLLEKPARKQTGIKDEAIKEFFRDALK